MRLPSTDSDALELIRSVADSLAGNFLAETQAVCYLRRGEATKAGLAREAVARAEELAARNDAPTLSPQQEAEMLAVIEAERTRLTR